MTTIIQRPAVVSASGTVTRPADTTQYAAADAWTNSASEPTAAAGLVALSLAGKYGGSGLITDILCTRSDVDVTAADFDIVLLTAAPTMTNDNAAFALTDAEALTIVGSVSIAAADWKVSTANAWVHKPVNIGFVCASDSVTLYAAIVVRGTYTPASGEVFGIKVKAKQD